jgi:hypothetical protein
LPYNNIKEACLQMSKILGFEPLNDLDVLDTNINKYELLFAPKSLYNASVIFILKLDIF